MAKVPREPTPEPRQADRRRRADLEAAEDHELLAAPDDSIVEAFGIFYSRYQLLVLKYLIRRTSGDIQTALDLTAETFLRAFEKRHLYEPLRAPAGAWLIGLAKYAFVDAYRRSEAELSARRRLGFPNLQYSDEAIAQVEERLDASGGGYLDGLDHLPDAERHAVRARVIDDRSYSDIAQETQASQAAIRQRVSRGLAKLKNWKPDGQ